jgi:hypothetical protein
MKLYRLGYSHEPATNFIVCTVKEVHHCFTFAGVYANPLRTIYRNLSKGCESYLFYLNKMSACRKNQVVPAERNLRQTAENIQE